MRRTNRLKEKVELSLDSRQIFFLVFGGAAVACLVFVMGIMVGKRLEARRIRQNHPCGADLAELDRIDEKPVKLTFHKVLVKKDTSSNLPPEVAETAYMDGAEAGRRASSAGGQGMAGGQGTAGGQGMGKASPSARGEDDVAGADDEGREAGLSHKRLGRRRARRHDRGLLAGLDGKRRGRRATVSGRQSLGREQEEADPEEKARDRERPAVQSGFTLQVSSFRARDDAESMMRRLESKGLQPYLVSTYIPQRGMWYRIRVGSYPDYGDAVHAKKEFESRWRVTAYVTRRH